MQAGQILQGRYQLQEPLGHHSSRQTSRQTAARQTWLALDLAPRQEPNPNPTQVTDRETDREIGVPKTSATPATVVIKLLAFHPQLQWDEWKLFEREAQILRQLNHPRVPQCNAQFSLEPVAGVAWWGLVQSYIPGTSLQQLLNQGYHFSEIEVQQIAIEILEILADLHALCPPVLHRDLKPSNLILTPERQMYLVDFGAGQNQAIATGGSFTVVGTYGYTPMEQFGGRTVPASDLYALGATLVHLLTGTDPADLPQRHLQLQWRSHASSRLSPTFAHWIDQLIAPAVEARFVSAEQALAAIACPLEPAASNATVLSPRVPNPTIAEQRSLPPQPPSSQIQIHQFTETLQIQISVPPRAFLAPIRWGGRLLVTLGIVSLPVWLAVLAITPLTPLTVFPESMLPLIICTPFLLFWHAFFLAGLGVFSSLGQEAIPVLQLLQGQRLLSLNRDCLVIESRWWGIGYRWRHELTPNIQQVSKANWGRIALQGVGKDHLFGLGLATAEQEWLVQEIQAWLQTHAAHPVLSTTPSD